MKYRNSSIIALTFALATACAHTAKSLDNIPLVWKPTSSIDLTGANLSNVLAAKIQFEPFKDTRKDPALVAENREDATPKPVTTRDNVGEFVATHLRGAFDRAGLTTVDSGGDIVITGEVRQFFVEETTTYKGDVLLHVKVRNRAGDTLWNGTPAGTAKRFGHSYSAENYYEVFSDSVLSAASAMLKDPEFRNALARK